MLVYQRVFSSTQCFLITGSSPFKKALWGICLGIFRPIDGGVQGPPFSETTDEPPPYHSQSARYPAKNDKILSLVNVDNP